MCNTFQERISNASNLGRHNSLPCLVENRLIKEDPETDFKITKYINKLIIPIKETYTRKSLSYGIKNWKNKINYKHNNKIKGPILVGQDLQNKFKQFYFQKNPRLFAKNKILLKQKQLKHMNQNKILCTNDLNKQKLSKNFIFKPIIENKKSFRRSLIIEKTLLKNLNGNTSNYFKNDNGKVNAISKASKLLYTENSKRLKEIEEEKEKKKKSFQRKINLWMNAIIEIYQLLKIQNLVEKSINYFDVFSKFPYEKPQSIEFFNFVKSGNAFEVSNLLRMNRFLLYDYDNLKQTPLHWAAKRGDVSLIKYFIEIGLNINSKDLLSRTPLFLAAKYDFIKVIKILLIEMADPFISSVQGLRPYDVATSYKSKRILMLAEKVYKRLKNFNPEMKAIIFHYSNQQIIDFYL